MSPSWVKAGALYALGWNASDLGAQSAELAAKILRGEQVSQLPPQVPRQLTYSVNLKAARHCNLSLSEKIIKEATHVFK
jgi:putative ABC transport system substrate-binding protein